MGSAKGTTSGQSNPLAALAERVEGAEGLDGLAESIAGKVRSVIPAGSFKDAISGTWLGHALHPMLTDVVIGSFTSATLLDLLGGDRDGKASERLIGIGIAAAGPTVLSGANDWADGEPGNDPVRRVGIVHAATNTVALSLYMASLIARRRGDRSKGTALGAAGALVLGAGGYLGGDLTLSQGQGVDQSVFDRGPEDWTGAIKSSELTENEPTRAIVDDTPVLLLRRSDRVLAIHDRCSHRGCSLSDGELEGNQIVCACHGSRFELSDGSLRSGPASTPQPAFETRELDGNVEVRLQTSA